MDWNRPGRKRAKRNWAWAAVCVSLFGGDGVNDSATDDADDEEPR
jgi:hypothetical protein